MLIALVRTVILYLFIVFGIRLLGKRQIGELEPSELVLSLIIADLASVPMQDYGIPLLSGIVPILTLLALSSLLSILTVKSIPLRALLCGRPSVIIREGKINAKEMLKNRFTNDELLEELRLSGSTDISKIRCAILETSGRLSVIPYAREQPLTPAQMQVNVPESGLPLILINDGRTLSKNLHARGLDSLWLAEQLHARGIPSADEIFLLTLDEGGSIYYSRKQEPIASR